jgi:NAD+ kinase
VTGPVEGPQTVALVRHPERDRAAAIEAQIRTWLEAHGHVASDTIPGADLVVSIGGDGTMLRAVDQASRRGTPVLGINVGQLGYLTEVDPSAWPAALERWARGEARVVERMLLAVRIDRTGADEAATAPDPPPDGAPEPMADGSYLALNEVVVEKTPIGRMVRLAVVLDGAFFNTYAADGMIVATPTGSTAYALSARGPIVDPEHRALVLTPVAPHMLLDRALVLTPATEVRLEVRGDRPATVAIDGRSIGELRVGEALVATASATPARLLTFGDRNFHSILKAKFGLEDR